MTTPFRRFFKITITSRAALCALLLAMAALTAVSARAQTNIFSENFSSVTKDSPVTNATGWSSRQGGNTNEVILLDDYNIPDINGATKALRLWSQSSGAGDVISPWINFTLAVYSGKPVSLSFDLFSVQDHPGGDNSLLLGFVSAMSRPYGITTWVAGQNVGAPHSIYAPYGEWTHIDLDITSDLQNWQNTEYFGLLNWSGRGFDEEGLFLTNFKVTILPEPATGMLFSAGLAVVGIVGWRRCRRS